MTTFPIITLLIIAVITLGITAVALFLKNIIHCSILLAVSWVGIAAFYLWAGAEFVAFAQVLVYVGAVSMVVLFAVLLTQRKQLDLEKLTGTVGFRELGKLAAAMVATVLVIAIATTPLTGSFDAINEPVITVRDIGIQLRDNHIGALLIVGVLLTVALLGAVVVASAEPKTEE
ncbi:MAG: NADH-quinone oxidoreductase subunit J [Puniceicoccales bacterium]|jgi:NADH:ubiquinone oxidoreductase subunit 6 (subunit J)|nr:NADH-quinone oxidoreductase subunit J [Puniceicoccales bacterium]